MGAAVQVTGGSFFESTGISPTTFGLRAVGDPHLMRELARGRSPTLRTVDRILAYIAAFELDGGEPGLRPHPHGAAGLRHGRGERGAAER